MAGGQRGAPGVGWLEGGRCARLLCCSSGRAGTSAQALLRLTGGSSWVAWAHGSPWSQHLGGQPSDMWRGCACTVSFDPWAAATSPWKPTGKTRHKTSETLKKEFPSSSLFLWTREPGRMAREGRLAATDHEGGACRWSVPRTGGSPTLQGGQCLKTLSQNALLLTA